jgi:hypothetical protein
MSTSSKITERNTSEYEFTRAQRERMLSRTTPPEMMQPPATSELTARPMRSPDSWTNFAGGLYSFAVRRGHWGLYRSNSGLIETRSIEASWYAWSVPTSRQ